MEYKITETIWIEREFVVEAPGEHQAIDQFTHETAKLINEKESHYYQVYELEEIK